MPRIELEKRIAAPVELVFDLSLDIDLHQSSMAGSGEKAIDGVTSGRIEQGQDVTWSARHFGLPWRMQSWIPVVDRPRHFRDEQKKGPFAMWRHDHFFSADGDDACVMRDVIEFHSPLGPLGWIAESAGLTRYLRHLIEVRNDAIERAALDALRRRD